VLNTIRELDRKTLEMQHKVETQVATIAQMAGSRSSKDDLEAMQNELRSDQCLLIQWAEEKVQLAVLGHELLVSHAKNLDLDIHNLTQFLTDTGQLEDYLPEEYGIHPDAHMYDSEPMPRSGRRGGSSSRGAGGYTTSADVYEDEQPAAGAAAKQQQSQKLRTNIPLTLNRQPSSQQMYDDGDSKGLGLRNKRGRTAGETTRTGRRVAAVNATTAVVAALYDEEDEYLDQKQPTTSSAAALPPASADPGQYAPPIPLPPFIPGMAECAKKPQAARRRLEAKDIGKGLVGKVAEVYWEDADNADQSMWYLVKVESVDLASKTACVRYQNGEVESALSLLEAARDGIMLLV
jgi:hypothetical protein